MELGAGKSKSLKRQGGLHRALTDDKGRELLLRATERLHLTARGYHRVLRVARTIADLDGADRIARSHIGEAIAFRRIALERKS